MPLLTQKIKKQIDEFFKENPKSTDEELNTFLQSITVLPDLAERTVLSRYSNIKRYVRDEYNRLVKDYKPQGDIVDRVIRADEKRRADKANFVITRKIIDELEGLKDSLLLPEQIIYLMFVSGRRINEIVEDTIKMNLIPKQPQRIRALSLSKQKEDKPESFEIRLIPASEFKRRLIKVRALTKGSLVNTLLHLVNRRLKKMGVNNCHQLRGIYVKMLFEDSDKSQNINGFITKNLNHSSNDTSLSYSNYILADDF